MKDKGFRKEANSLILSKAFDKIHRCGILTNFEKSLFKRYTDNSQKPKQSLQVFIDRLKTMFNLSTDCDNILLFDKIVETKKKTNNSTASIKPVNSMRFLQEKQKVLKVVEELKGKLKEKDEKYLQEKRNNDNKKMVLLLEEKEDKLKRFEEKYSRKKQKLKYDIMEKNLTILNLLKIIERYESGDFILNKEGKRKSVPTNAIRPNLKNQTKNRNSNYLQPKNIFKSRLSQSIDFSIEDKIDNQEEIMNDLHSIELNQNPFKLDQFAFDTGNNNLNKMLSTKKSNTEKSREENENPFQIELDSFDFTINDANENPHGKLESYKDKLKEYNKTFISTFKIIEARQRYKQDTLNSLFKKHADSINLEKNKFKMTQIKIERINKIIKNLLESLEKPFEDKMESGIEKNLFFIEEELVKEKYSIYEKDVQLRNMKDKISGLEDMNKQLISKITVHDQLMSKITTNEGNKLNNDLISGVFGNQEKHFNINVVQSSVVAKSRIQQRFNIRPSQVKETKVNKQDFSNSFVGDEDNFMKYESKLYNIFNQHEVNEDDNFMEMCYKNLKKRSTDNYYEALSISYYDHINELAFNDYYYHEKEKRILSIITEKIDKIKTSTINKSIDQLKNYFDAKVNTFSNKLKTLLVNIDKIKGLVVTGYNCQVKLVEYHEILTSIANSLELDFSNIGINQIVQRINSLKGT